VPRDATLTELQVISEPLGGSALSRAAQAGNVSAEWYVPRPPSTAEWRARAVHVASTSSGSGWAEALAPALQASGEAADRLRRVAAEGGVVVTTGQQPGLFGGPVYTFSKAITALALADELESQLGLPVAPVFWAATDDADFEEARWTQIAVVGSVEHLSVASAPPPGTPMSLAILGDVTRELAALERASGSAAYAPAIDAVGHAYRPNQTIGGAYVGLLRTLLEPLGIAVLDASHVAVRRQGARILRDAMVRAVDIAAAVRQRADSLRAAGFEPQVSDEMDLSLVFGLRNGIKQRIPVRDAGTAARGDVDTLSPNVLLRPVLERAVLPTVAYAAGPAELAYFAQVSAVADSLGAERPLAVPRWSCTIIEPHLQRLLDRLGVEYSELAKPHALEGRIARAALPSSVTSSLARVREAIERVSATLTSDGEAAALLSARAVTGARGSLLDRLQRLERRYVAAVKRREEQVMREVATARAHLYPNGKRQERALNFIPMLARQGPTLLSAMRETAALHARALVAGDYP
jgi:bacillithiol biosynthesis cysteine-adding enzyme BshC